MFFTDLESSLAAVDRWAEGISVAEAEPEGDESFLYIFLQHLLESVDVKVEVENVRIIDVWNCSFVADIFYHQCSFGADMAAFTKIANKFENSRVVYFYSQLFPLYKFGHMDAIEDRLRCRVIDDATSTILHEKMFRQPQSFGWPVNCYVFNLGPGGGHVIVEHGSLIDHVEHLSENICDVDSRGVVAEIFRGLPLHATWENNFFGHFHEVFDFPALLWWVFGKLMPEKTRLNIGVDRRSSFIFVDLLCALFDELKHLVASFHEGVEIEEGVGHVYQYIYLLQIIIPILI